MLTYFYEDAKDKLVTCSDDATKSQRGEALAYRKLIDTLTRQSVK